MAMVNSAEYCAFRASFEKLVISIKNSVEKVARKAFEKNLITDQNLHIAGIQSIDNEHRASILLQQILSKIESNPAHLYTFVSILESEPVLKDVADELKAKLSEFKRTSDQQNKQSLDTYDRGPAKKESVATADPQFSFPSIVLQSISADERLRLESRLYYESMKMGVLFGNLYSSTFASLKKQNIPPLEIVNVLVGQSLCEPVFTDSDQPSFRKQLSKLRKAETVDEIMDIVIDYCSFFNFQIIECLISKLGSDEDKIALLRYKDAFADYAKRKVYEIPSKVCPESDNCQALVYVTLDKSFDQFTVNELLFFQGKLCEVLQVSPNSLQLCHIKPGSLKLIFQVPSFAEQPVFPLTQDKEEALTKLGVTYLSYSFMYQFSSPESIKFQQEYVMKKTKKVEKQEMQDPTQELSLKDDQIKQLSGMVGEQEREIAKMDQKFFEMKTNAYLREKDMKTKLDDALMEANKMKEEMKSYTEVLSLKEEETRRLLERIAEQEKEMAKLQETLPSSQASLAASKEYSPSLAPTLESSKIVRLSVNPVMLKKDPSRPTAIDPSTIKLYWRTGKNAPCDMTSDNTDAAVDGDTVYIRISRFQSVFAYNSSNDTWSLLPTPPPTTDFSLAVVNDMLTTIGGSLNQSITDRLFSLTGEHDNGKWEEIFPPMPTERLSKIRTVCSKTHLIVGDEHSKVIEVMDTASLQWSRVADLPAYSSLHSLVVCEEYLYACAVHEDKNMFRCSTVDLIRSAHAVTTNIWSVVEHTVHTDILLGSTFVSIQGQLVSVAGGYNSNRKPTTYVRMYSPTTKRWDVIGHMETPRYNCVAAFLSNNSLVVVGGFTISVPTISFPHYRLAQHTSFRYRQRSLTRQGSSSKVDIATLSL